MVSYHRPIVQCLSLEKNTPFWYSTLKVLWPWNPGNCHSRSLKITPFDWLNMTSYQCSIVSMAVYCTIFWHIGFWKYQWRTDRRTERQDHCHHTALSRSGARLVWLDRDSRSVCNEACMSHCLCVCMSETAARGQGQTTVARVSRRRPDGAP